METVSTSSGWRTPGRCSACGSDERWNWQPTRDGRGRVCCACQDDVDGATRSHLRGNLYRNLGIAAALSAAVVVAGLWSRAPELQDGLTAPCDRMVQIGEARSCTLLPLQRSSERSVEILIGDPTPGTDQPQTERAKVTVTVTRYAPERFPQVEHDLGGVLHNIFQNHETVIHERRIIVTASHFAPQADFDRVVTAYR